MGEDSRIDARRLSKEPTLRKLASHARWFIEKTRAKPEQCIVTISVPDDETKMLLCHQFEHEYDASIMRRYLGTPNVVDVLGVRIQVLKRQLAVKNDAIPRIPPKETA